MVDNRVAGRVLLRLLDYSGRGSAKTLSEVAEEAGVTEEIARRVLKRIAEENPSDNTVILPEDKRIEVAFQAVAMGVPLDDISTVLKPKDFEDFTSRVLRETGFEVRSNFSFKSSGRRHQIDVLALKDRILLSIDCKRWRQGFSFKKIQQLAESQATRTRNLVAYLSQIHGPGAVSTFVVPVVIGLTEPPRRIVGRSPIVPIHTITSFAAQTDSILHDLERFELRTDRKILLGRL